MEYRLVFKNGREDVFDADNDKDAVRKAFKILNIRGRIRTYKFYAAGAVAIYCQNKKIFPIP